MTETEIAYLEAEIRLAHDAARRALSNCGGIGRGPHDKTSMTTLDRVALDVESAKCLLVKASTRIESTRHGKCGECGRARDLTVYTDYPKDEKTHETYPQEESEGSGEGPDEETEEGGTTEES